MTTRQIHRLLIVCDGCGTAHNPDGANSEREGRYAAYNDGWRYPPQIKKDGTPARTTSDVCPNCINGWTPQPIRARAGYQRMDGTIHNR